MRNPLKQKDFISFDNLEFHPQSLLKLHLLGLIMTKIIKYTFVHRQDSVGFTDPLQWEKKKHPAARLGYQHTNDSSFGHYEDVIARIEATKQSHEDEIASLTLAMPVETL